MPAAQMLEGTANCYVRVRPHTAALEPTIRAAVREVDATLPVSDVRTQTTNSSD